MKQAVMVEPGKIVFQDAPRPVPGPDQVLLKMKHIGVCGSDVHVFHGQHPFTSYPVIQGHECSAVIEEVGTGVRGFAVGARVTFTPQLVCGECPPCKRGDYHICDHLKVYGFQADGAAREYFAIPTWNLVLLPKAVTLGQGAFVELFAVGLHAVGRLAAVNGRNVVVVGAGPIGNCCAQAAKAQGGNVVIADLDDFKLSKARDCGLTQTINVAAEDLKTGVARYLRGGEIDALIDCAGTQESLKAAIHAVRKGGEIIIVAVFGIGVPTDIGIIQDREISLKGSLMYRKDDFAQAARLMADGKFIADPLITHHFPFAEYPAAYDLINRKKEKFVKVMIDVAGP